MLMSQNTVLLYPLHSPAVKCPLPGKCNRVSAVEAQDTELSSRGSFYSVYRIRGQKPLIWLSISLNCPRTTWMACVAPMPSPREIRLPFKIEVSLP